jgi:UDP-N-acetylmuramate dehydrogenase
VDELAEVAAYAQKNGLRTAYLGWGSNILPSDRGIPGLVVLNLARSIRVDPNGEVVADAGCGFQEMFLKTAQAGLAGFSFAVGIPGTVGGALVSNAGAYRACVSDFLTEIEVVHEGQRKWVSPEIMRFDYRDSVLRSPDPPEIALLRVRMKLEPGDPRKIYDDARDYQRQRIAKQPPPASAGSFFKNVNDKDLAERLDALPESLRKAGVVPSGFLIEHAGLMGTSVGGAVLSGRHGNFILNVGGASASDIRRLAELAKRRVREAYGVEIEEEVLYLGDWSGWEEEAG